MGTSAHHLKCMLLFYSFVWPLLTAFIVLLDPSEGKNSINATEFVDVFGREYQKTTDNLFILRRKALKKYQLEKTERDGETFLRVRDGLPDKNRKEKVKTSMTISQWPGTDLKNKQKKTVENCKDWCIVACVECLAEIEHRAELYWNRGRKSPKYYCWNFSSSEIDWWCMEETMSRRVGGPPLQRHHRISSTKETTSKKKSNVS